MSNDDTADDDAMSDGKPLSVAELLARNGGQRVSTGGRRRRGMEGGITVAELTGEIPVYDAATPAAMRPSHGAPPVTSTPVTSTPAAFSPAAPTPVADTPAAPGDVRPSTPEPTAYGPAQPTRTVPARPYPADNRPAPDRSTYSAPSYRPVVAPVDESVTDESPVVAPVTVYVTATPIDTDVADASDDNVEPATEPRTTEPRTTKRAKKAEQSPARQWLSVAGQALVAIVVGALLFKGFEKLWDVLPWVALVLSFFVIVGLVAVVRVLRRTDDLVSILLAVLVGSFVTLGPLAFMLSTN